MDEQDRLFIEALIDKQGEQFRQQIVDVTEDFKQHVTALSESFDLKIGMLAEGHQLLTEKLNQIATDVAAHRADTEAHSALYSVREEHPQYTVGELDAD